MTNRWVINRVGLLNFWYYQNQIFQLAEGKMLLRGTNGSGKSLTMQSLFPVLFDGDTNPYRLDSFGSSDRKMEDYLLGEKGVSDRDQGTGYLYLEVKKEEREEFLTVGIGMHANRGGKLTKWFFTIENNQRIGIDFELFEEVRKDELVPLTKAKLKKRLENIGRLFDKQSEYKKFVNERIFGFQDLGQFDELISLLIRLRKPKLSKDFSPSVIYGILRDSLPRLQDDELLPLSKTIERIDGHRERLEDLKNELKELADFSKGYQKWRREFIGQVGGKWCHYLEAKKRLGSVTEKGTEKQARLTAEIELQRNLIKVNEAKLEILETDIQSLNQHEGIGLVKRGQELAERLEQISQQLDRDRTMLVKKRSHLLERTQKLGEEEISKAADVSDLEAFLMDNEQYLPYLNFKELDAVYAQKIRTCLTDDEYRYWKRQIEDKKNHFQQTGFQLRKLEELQHQLKDLKREEGDIQQGIDELNRDIRQWQETRRSEIERWKNEFDTWLKKIPFEVSEQTYSNVLYGMDRMLEEEVREEEIYRALTSSYQEAVANNQAEQEPLKFKLRCLEEQKQEKKKQISEWQDRKIPEPEQSEARLKNRQSMAGEKNFIPFYKSVDFVEEVPKAMRDRIEGALHASGILDSLITSDELPLFDDMQVVPQLNFSTLTLADYLKVDPNVTPELRSVVESVLQSILVDEHTHELAAVFSDGSYQIANVRGKMQPDYQSSYIGTTSQESFRQSQILQLEKEMNQLDEEIKAGREEIEKIRNKRQLIEDAYGARPTGQEVYLTINEIGKIILNVKSSERELIRKSNQVRQHSERVNREKNEIQRKTSLDQLRLETSVYEEAFRYAKNYEENIRDAYEKYQKIQATQKLIEEISDSVRVYEEEVNSLRFAIVEQESDESKQQQLIEKNKEQQALMDIQELHERLTKATTEQKALKDAQKQAREDVLGLEKEKAANENQLRTDQDAFQKIKYEENYWHKLFAAEVGTISGDERSLEEKANAVQLEASINKLRELESSVVQRFNFLVNQVQNYQPQLLNVAVLELSEAEEQSLGDFANYNHFKQPKFTYEGETQLVFDLLEHLKSQKLTLQDMLKQEDEKLFKTIILDSVGNILRSRINQGMKWVEKMNELLESQKNSSGLNLSIKWKGVPSASEDDLGTVRLVELLQKPTNILSVADQEAISLHFQEKVRYAQEQIQENTEERSTLFQAISRVLDYRDWFEFELRYRRANDGYSPQALTNRKFNQFSGGEKAVAMYLPLFTAVHSRYGEAGDFCPKIITLDEAFAGIDDTNISELFRACEELGFNYVMNSQALFGDYPTVSNLMIYELLRPQNINLVTAIRYFWNGKRKELILEDTDD